MDKQVCPRKPYPTDVSDDEWVFVAPYLTLMVPEAPQRRYELREVFNALRWIVRAGAPCDSGWGTRMRSPPAIAGTVPRFSAA